MNRRAKPKSKTVDLIIARDVPAEDMRYCSCGDYLEMSPGHWAVRVSKMRDWRYNFLVKVHEIVELGLIVNAGIPEPKIMAFDKRFERRNVPDDAEPGDASDSPYRRQHAIAEGIERILAAEMNVDWLRYGEACNRAYDRVVEAKRKCK